MKPLTPFKRFWSGNGKEHAVIFGRKNGARIYITASRYNDCFWTLALIHRYMMRAERAVKLMKKVGTTASQCEKEWLQIKYCLEYIGFGPERNDQQEAETSSHPSEETAACSEDK